MKQAVEEKKISLSAAEQIAKLPQEEQAEVIERHLQTKKLPKNEKANARQTEAQNEPESVDEPETIDNTGALAEGLTKFWDHFGYKTIGLRQSLHCSTNSLR